MSQATVDLWAKMKKLGMPFDCPSCGTTLVWKSVDLHCPNRSCGDKNLKEVTSFIVKCGVENATEKSLANWNITTYADLLSFDPDCLSKAQDNFAAELVKNVFSKPKEELFGCMNFDGAGRSTIEKLIEFYGKGDIDLATRNLYLNGIYTYGEISEFPEGIGQKVIDKIEHDWKLNLHILRDIVADKRYNPKAKAVAGTGNLEGMTFLLTGAMSEPRNTIEKLICQNGGKIASSVSKTLSILVCAPDSWGSSSKYVKAVKNNVKIITEDDLRGMI